MNITALNLIFPLLVIQSPAFIGNHLSFINSKFTKFTSVLFYNQKSLYLEKSKFTQGINGIIYKDSQNDQESFYQKTYDSSNFKSSFYEKIEKINDKSISIIDCIFQNLLNSDTNSILISNDNVSVYMSDNIFNNCQSKDGVIRLRRSRCVTVTHTCSLNSKSKYEYYFYYYDCRKEDFSIFLYSTIVNSESLDDQEKDTYTLFCKDGNQYSRCNNITGTSNGIKYDAPFCFSYAMNTITDCKYICFYLSGNNDQADCATITPKEIEMVNFVSTGYENNVPVFLSSSCSFKLTIINSVLQANNHPIYQYDEGDKNKIILILKDCFVTSQNYHEHVTFENCKDIGYNPSQITIFPHYTRGVYCRGEPLKNESAKHGCNVGNCIDSHCNNTIGFPPGVPQYTTFIHTDLQSASFTPSQKFSQSSIFTESLKFTSSMKFTSSLKFTDSGTFSASDDFDRTSRFTKSKTFSSSSQFSASKNPFIVDDGDSKNDGKGSDKNKMIGIIAGSVGGAAAVAGGLAAFFLIKKRVGIKVEDDPTMNTEKKPGVNVENDLDDVMDQDDPFADEFANH